MHPSLWIGVSVSAFVLSSFVLEFEIVFRWPEIHYHLCCY